MIPEFKEARMRNRILALLSIWKWLVVALIVVIGLVNEIFSSRTNPIDDQMIKSRELVRQIYVVDERRNGFRIRYITKESVTSQRLDEIRQRQSVKDSLERLIIMASRKFGNMLKTDIYDFADFAILFDPVDIEIHDIFVCGPDKEKLYIGENPRIENWAKWIDPNTLQGLLYITTDDIYHEQKEKSKIYRYWNCPSIHQISATDEHFSHFSETERQY